MGLEFMMVYGGLGIGFTMLQAGEMKINSKLIASFSFIH